MLFDLLIALSVTTRASQGGLENSGERVFGKGQQTTQSELLSLALIGT